MKNLNDSVEKLIARLNKNSGRAILTKEDFQKAEKEINAKMEKFSREHNIYMQRSRESASRAYITF
jgi:hypothetical protein